MKVPRIFWVVILLFVSSAPRAEAEPLSTEAALKAADLAFPLLQAAELETAIAEGEKLSAQGGFDASWKTRGTVTPVGYYESVRVESIVEKPTALWGASFFAGYRLGTGNFPSYDGKQQTLEYGEVRAGATLPLWKNGPIDRRRANVSKAELGVSVAQLSVREQRIQLHRTVLHRYWAWVASGERLRIAELLLQNVSQRNEALMARVAAGDLPDFERADNARAIEQRRAQVAAAWRGLEQAANELGLLLRDEQGNPRTPQRDELPGGFSDPIWDDGHALAADLAHAQANRPEPQRIGVQSEQGRIELGWAQNQLRPGVDLQVAASSDLGQTPADRPDLREPVLEASVLIDIPIETRLMRGRVAATKAGLSRLELQRKYAEERVLVDVQNAYATLRNAKERISAGVSEIKLARDLENLERTRFEQGEGHLLFVNLREQQTAEAELRTIDAYQEYFQGLADLNAARGDLGTKRSN